MFSSKFSRFTSAATATGSLIACAFGLSMSVAADVPRSSVPVPKLLTEPMTPLSRSAVLRRSSVVAASGVTAASAAAPIPALSPSAFESFPVVKVENANYNCKLITFKLPTENHTLGSTTASCIVLRSTIDGKDVRRPYTPITADDQRGLFTLLVKVYPTGVMSKYIGSLKPGDSIAVSGPFPKFQYQPNQFDTVGLIAGGSGLTPMLQIARKVATNPQDNTKVVLLFANETEEDIVLRKELEDLSKISGGRVRVVYTLSKPPAGWKGETGYVSKEMIAKYMPAPSANGMVMVCGPEPMMKALSGNKVSPKDQGPLTGLLAELGYKAEQVYKF